MKYDFILLTFNKLYFCYYLFCFCIIFIITFVAYQDTNEMNSHNDPKLGELNRFLEDQMEKVEAMLFELHLSLTLQNAKIDFSND